jgi:diguanylate cyclase (GGDEF)-like protein
VENEVIERFLRDVRDALGADEVRLWEHDAGDDEPRTLASSNGRGWEAPLITNPPVESLVHWAVQQGMPANNYDDESAYFLAAPVGREGRFQGAIGLWAADRRSVSRERAKATLGGYATRLAILLDLLNDGRETRRYRGKAEKVVKAAERIQSNTEQVALLDAICETAVEISGATRAAFVLWSEPTGTGRVAAVSAPHVIAPGYVVASDSLVAMACRERQRFTIRESYRKSDFPLFGAGEPSRRVSSLAVVPIWRDVRTLGAICVEGDQTAQLTKVEGELLSLLSTNIAVALDNVSQLAIVTQQSLRDGLTGLANRRSFDERLRQHLGESDRFGQQTSLILLDVDHFKRINDGYGHDVGDRVLIAVAQAVATGVRSIDLCARYGGEELAVLLPQTHLQSAVEVAERLRRSIASIVLPTERGEVRVTASFGVASYPESVGTQDALFVAADRALYGAKHAGRNCVKPAMVKLPGTGS